MRKPYHDLSATSYLMILILIIFIAFFFGITTYSVVDVNEGLYAEIAREMLATGNYFIPHLNNVPYLAKPPLLYWLLAICYHFFGISSGSARLVPAISSTIVCLSFPLFGKLIQRTKEGLIAGLILATGAGFVIIGRVVFFDMVLTAFLTVALCSFYLWHQKEKPMYLQIAYVALALAFMTKGLLAILLFGFIVIFFMAFTKTPSKKFLKLFDPTGLALFIIIVGFWAVQAAKLQPNFFNAFFSQDQISGIFNVFAAHNYNAETFYHYIPRTLIYLAPWCLLIPILFWPINKKISKWNPLTIFLWLWFLIPFIVFTLSADKSDYYMVIGAPPLAMLLAIKLENIIRKNKHIILAVVFVLAIILFEMFFGYIIYFNTMPNSMTFSLMVLFAFLLLYGIAGCYLAFYSKNAVITFLMMAGLVIPLVVFYINFKVTTQDKYTQATIANYIKTNDKNRQVYLYQDYKKVSSLPFLLQTTIPIIDVQKDDILENTKGPIAKKSFMTTDDFVKFANKNPCYVIVLKDNFDTFNKIPDLTVQFVKVAASKKVLLLSNTK
jgi:4-amino-4-deoxy-L-arabinose transferase-like glycosyltransferase